MTGEPKIELPDGWDVRRISEVAAVNPKVNKKEIPDDLLVSFVPMPAVGAEDGSIDVSDHRPFAEVKKGYTGFSEGDVLFAKITPCMENGKMAVVPPLANGYGFGSTEFHVLRPSDEVDSKYLYYYVSSKQFRGEAERHMSGAVGQRRVPTPYLKDCLIPIAPPEQQKRIVAEIEKQFSRLDEAVANLKRVKANLKRYKAAVLKAAVEGKLTEEWRKAHPDVEPASKLLDRILAERRAKWEEAELAKMEAKGKTPKNDKWKAKYKEPVGSERSDLPGLSEKWVWATVDQLVAHLTDGDHQPPPQTDQGIPFLVIGNVRNGEIDFSKTRYVGKEYYATLDPFRRPQLGDLLYTLVGSYGIPVRVRTEKPFCIQRHMAILRPHGQSPMDYLTVAMASNNVFNQATSVATGTAQKTVPLAGLRRILIALPPTDEQDRIVTEVDRHLSLIRETETQVDTNLKRAKRLRQSILSKAFSGVLTSDEEQPLPTQSEALMVAEPAGGYGANTATIES